MRTNFVLIDAENVKPENIEKLKHDYFRVVVFVGSNLKCLDITIVKALQSLGSNGSYVQNSTPGPNALDFHIAYYIGKFSAADPDGYFHIISRDKGFDPLITHLKEEQNIFCSRWESVLEIPLLKSADRPTPSQLAAEFYKKRIATNKARPTTLEALKRAILSHFPKLSDEEVAKVVKALKAAGHLVVNGTKVAYPGPQLTQKL